MADPTLSVVLPCYNMDDTVAQSIEAILTQSRRPDEFLIVDDTSTDRSPDIIAAFAAKDPLVTVRRNPSNRGQLPILDQFVREARGDYIHAAAADDYILPGFYESVMNLARRFPQAGIYFGQLVFKKETGEEDLRQVRRWRQELFATPSQFLREYLDCEAATHSLSAATVYRAAALRAVGGYRQELSSWADTFNIRALGLKHGACYVPRPGAVWRVREDSWSASIAADPRRRLDIVGRAMWLMRSPEFSNEFPAAHVERWGRAYRLRIIVRHALDQLRRRRWLAAVRSIALFRYQPDVSCYGAKEPPGEAPGKLR